VEGLDVCICDDCADRVARKIARKKGSSWSSLELR